MSPNVVVGIAFILAGLLIGFAGYQIRFKGRLNLIAGYDPNSVKDKEGLGRWVGSGIMVLGIVQAICGLLALIASVDFAGLLFLLATVTVPVILLTRISRFTN
jgi:hypothetical protein